MTVCVCVFLGGIRFEEKLGNEVNEKARTTTTTTTG